MTTTKLGKAMQTIKQWDYETLEAAKYLLIFVIVIDLFGIYWWLGLKQLGIFLMVLTMVAFAVIIILQSKLKGDKTNGKKQIGNGFEPPQMPEVWSPLDTKNIRNAITMPKM